MIFSVISNRRFRCGLCIFIDTQCRIMLIRMSSVWWVDLEIAARNAPHIEDPSKIHCYERIINTCVTFHSSLPIIMIYKHLSRIIDIDFVTVEVDSGLSVIKSLDIEVVPIFAIELTCSAEISIIRVSHWYFWAAQTGKCFTDKIMHIPLKNYLRVGGNVRPLNPYSSIFTKIN